MTSESSVLYQPEMTAVHNDYLIDTNSLITAYNKCYRMSFKFTQDAFWNPLQELIEDGTIGLLDKVWREAYGKKESDDQLNTWLEKVQSLCIPTESDGAILEQYRQVLNLVTNCPDLFRQEAVQDWVPKNIADPWLIAAAKHRGAKIITFERYQKITTPGKHPKIPTVARQLGVECLTLYDFMEENERF